MHRQLVRRDQEQVAAIWPGNGRVGGGFQPGVEGFTERLQFAMDIGSPEESLAGLGHRDVHDGLELIAPRDRRHGSPVTCTVSGASPIWAGPVKKREGLVLRTDSVRHSNLDIVRPLGHRRRDPSCLRWELF